MTNMKPVILATNGCNIKFFFLLELCTDELSLLETNVIKLAVFVAYDWCIAVTRKLCIFQDINYPIFI